MSAALSFGGCSTPTIINEEVNYKSNNYNYLSIGKGGKSQYIISLEGYLERKHNVIVEYIDNRIKYTAE